MQMLNRYFTPFALILILSAIYFSEPAPAPSSSRSRRWPPRC